MRVLHLLDHLGPGGAQQLVLDLVQRLGPAGHQFTVCYMFDRHHFRSEFERAGCSVHFLGGGEYYLWNLADPRMFRRVARFLRDDGPFDLLHLHLYYTLLLVPWMVRKKGYPPSSLVYTLHALRRQLPFYVFPLLRVLSSRIGTFVTEAELSRVELLHLGIPPAKVVSTPLATVYADWPLEALARPGDLRKELGLAAGRRLVLNIGRFHKSKGQHLLIEAAAHVCRARPEVVFAIVGAGQEERHLRRLIEQTHLESNVFLLGYRRDLPNLYGSADVVAISSIQEGIGVVTLDAMAWGKPVVAFRGGALDEVIQHGKSGLLVPPLDVKAYAQRLIDCLDHPEESQSMGREGQAFVRRHHAPGSMVEVYERLYRSLDRAGGRGLPPQTTPRRASEGGP